MNIEIPFFDYILVLDPFYEYCLTLIPAWIENHMPRKAWDEITYPLPLHVASCKFGNG